MIRKHLGACVAVTGALFVVGSGLQACGGSDSNGGGGGGGKTDSGTGGDGGTAGTTGNDCGNGTIDGTEECDDGNFTSGDGCDNDCSFSCKADADCDDGNPCTGDETCGTDHACAAGTPLGEGDSCGTDVVCVSGLCVSASCGDGQPQTGEECDDGNVDDTDGCTSACKFTCISTDSTRDCTQTGDACNGSNKCDDTAHTCTGGTPLAEGAGCKNNTGTCKSGICTLKTCGNGTVDAGEQCEPPGTATCDAQCQNIVVAACGNGTIEGSEQCDDGNTTNLDGCDSNCKYEAVMRLRSASIMNGTAPSFCSVTKNQLGNVAITNLALGQVNTSLNDGINAGTTNVIVQALGLDDLTGTSDNALELGIMSGSLDPAKGAWPTNNSNPIDWWFKVDKTGVDGNGLPTGKLTGGALAAKIMTGGPSDINLSLLLSGSPALLEMRDAKLRGLTSGTPSAPAPPPSALASGLTVFPEMIADQTNQGLCGNITVASLAKIPIPESLAKNGSTACGNCSGSKEYNYCGANMPVSASCNSLLDALVGGCKAAFIVPCVGAAINPTQPDVPKPGGSLTPLSVQGSLNKVPNAQTDNNKDAYSSYLHFNARRAHITGSQ